MFYVNLLMAITSSFGLRRTDCLLSFLRETIDVHVYSPLLVTAGSHVQTVQAVRITTARLFKACCGAFCFRAVGRKIYPADPEQPPRRRDLCREILGAG